jgi:cysteine desulfurase
MTAKTRAILSDIKNRLNEIPFGAHIVYADNNADTQECEEALEIKRILTTGTQLGNPSAIHINGKLAYDVLKYYRQIMCKECGCTKGKLIFTSGATESNHLAITAGMNASKRVKLNRIVTTPFEHSSVARIITYYNPKIVKLHETGEVDLKSLAELCRDKEVGMISIILAHNELGIVQPFEEITRIVKAERKLRNESPENTDIPKPPFLHYDITQLLGKADFDFDASGADMASWSAHKFHGPGGVGGLFVSNLDALLTHPVCCSASEIEDSQEFGKRAGTENVIGIAEAVTALVATNERGRTGQWERIKKASIELTKEITMTCGDKFVVNASPSMPTKYANSSRLYNTVHISSTTGILGIDMMNYVNKTWGLSVSIGSACLKSIPSLPLSATGMSKDRINGAMRISLSIATTQEDIDIIKRALWDCKNHKFKS